MYGIILPRPAVNRGPTPLWQTIFNAALIAETKYSPIYGYQRSPLIGSIADGTIDLLAGAVINTISFDSVNVTLTLGASRPNSGFETLFVGSETYSRADATYTSGSAPSWKWTVTLGFPPFPIGPASNVLLGMS